MAVNNISVLTGTYYNTVEELWCDLDDIDLLLIRVKKTSGGYKSYSYEGEDEIECVDTFLMDKRIDRYDIRKKGSKYIAEVWCY